MFVPSAMETKNWISRNKRITARLVESSSLTTILLNSNYPPLASA